MPPTANHAPAVSINVTGQRFDCHSLSNRAGEYVIKVGESVEIVGTIETVGNLYIELRRAMGELGGAGPNRHDIRRAIATLQAKKAAAVPPDEPVPADLEAMERRAAAVGGRVDTAEDGSARLLTPS